MKTIQLLVLLAVSLYTFSARAGDEPVAQIAYTGTQGCTAALAASTSFSVQCTTDCYIRVTANSTTGPVTSTTSVQLAAGKLYDVDTTRTKVFICGLQVAAGGTMKVFRYQTRSNP
jgi:hypothetical protein